MNEQALHTNYIDNQRNSETTRESEAHALMNCSAKMELVRDPDTSREDLGIAIKLNQRLWTLFQVSLCEPTNQLPDDLKMTLINLSTYVDKTSFQILADDDREKINSLININRTLAKGLSVQPAETKTATQQTTPTPTTSLFTSA